MHRSIAAAAALALWLHPSAAGADATSGIARATLPNGLQVIAIRDAVAPVVTTVVAYKAGSEEDPPGLPGMAHAQEHMMFRGTPTLSSAQLGEIMSALGSDADADTSEALTRYYFTVPAEDLDVALHVEADRMSDVSDADADWGVERGAIEQEVAQDESYPEELIENAARGAMFAGTPDAEDALGTKASFDAMTAGQIKQFYETWYGPGDAVLVIAGDLDPAHAVVDATRIFGPVPARAHAPSVLPAPPLSRGSRITLQGRRAASSIFVCYRMPGYDSPDYAAGLILSDILATSPDLRWFPRDWADGVDYWNETFPSAGIAFAQADIPAGEQDERMIKVLENNVDDYVKDGFSRRDVEAAKRHEVLEAEADDGSIPDLAFDWVQAVALEGRSSPSDDIAAIDAVTVDDVNRVAAQYLVNDDAVVGTVLPAPPGSASSPSAAAPKEAVETTAGTSVAALPSWAQAATVLSSPHPQPATDDETLPNGMRLIVRRVPDTSTVLIIGDVAGQPALETPAGLDGEEELLQLAFFEGPADVLDEDWEGEMFDTGALLLPGRDFMMQMLRPDFDTDVHLLADLEMHPDISPDFFSRRSAALATVWADLAAEPDQQAAIATEAGLLPSGDPALRLPTKDSISALTFDELTRYYQTAFRPDLTTVVIVGDVTAAQARRSVESYFGAWASSGPRPPLALPPVPVNPPKVVDVPAPERVQDQVTLDEIVGVRRTDPDYYPLQIADFILGAGGLDSTWLYRDAREQSGLVYSIDSLLRADDAGRSRFGITYGCDPSNVSKVRAIVGRDIAQLQNAGPSAEDVKRAKLEIVRSFTLGQQSVGFIADGLLARAEAGLPLDEPDRDVPRYLAVTAAQVRAAAAKWLRPDGFVEVVEGPPPS